MKTKKLAALCACMCISKMVFAEGTIPPFSTLARAVLNEAEGEPYASKVAHAFLFRNRLRAGLPLGSACLNSRKVQARLKRTPLAVQWEAREAVFSAFYKGGADPTKGALYCENVKKFGTPGYIKRDLKTRRVVECARVGGIVFWRDAGK